MHKKVSYVHINKSLVVDSGHILHIDLGSCASVVLAGLDMKWNVFLGANHMFKSRDANTDMALKLIAELYNRMKDMGCVQIKGLGLFGAAYREKSLARGVAQSNVMTILEALSLYDLTVEVFETGYSQGISVLTSDSRESFLIKHHKLEERVKNIIEIPLSKVFD